MKIIYFHQKYWVRDESLLISDKTYIIENAVVDHFRPPDSWYQKYPWVNEDSYWMSLPYEDGKAYETNYIIQEQYTTYPGSSRMPLNTWNYECYWKADRIE